MTDIEGAVSQGDCVPAGPFQPALLGLAFVFFGDFVLLNAFAPHDGLPALAAGEPLFYVVEFSAFLAGVVLCGILLVVSYAMRHAPSWRVLLKASVALVAFGVVGLCALEVVGFTAAGWAQALTSAFPLGAVNTLLLGLWAQRYACESSRGVLLHSCCSVVLGIVLSVTPVLVPESFGQSVFGRLSKCWPLWPPLWRFAPNTGAARIRLGLFR